MKKLITLFAIVGMVLALAPAAQAAREIDITGLGISISDGDNTPRLADDTDFGFTWIDGGDIFKTYTVTNTGDAVLTLSNPASITGADAAQFLVGPLTSTSLNAGEAATFTVIYMESYTVAVHTATVNLVNDDSDEATYEFAITAETGIMPEIDITGNGISISDGDTTPSTNDYTDFGSVVIGTEAVKTYTVKNTGFGDLHLSPPTLTGTGTNQFTVGALTSTNVTSGQTATFTVTYTTTVARAEHTATVTLVNNDPDEEATYNFQIKALSWNPGPITLPPDGITTYRIAFQTIATGRPTNSTIAWYNDFVTASATNVPELAELYTTWYCIGSTLLTCARTNTGTLRTTDPGYAAANDVPIYTTDGNRIADNNNDLWNSSIQNPIRSEDGQSVDTHMLVVSGGPTYSAWTGTDADGASASSSAGGSYLGSGPNGDNTASYVRLAGGRYTDAKWISQASDHDGIYKHFLVLSAPITGVPTPGTLMFGK